MLDQKIENYINALAEHKHLLSPSQKESIYNLVKEKSSTQFATFVPSELDTLFTLVKTLQAKVVTGSGDLLANATTRDLSSLIGGITSLLRAFSAQQQKVDEAKELGDLKAAVLASIETLDTAAQQRFFKTLESYG